MINYDIRHTHWHPTVKWISQNKYGTKCQTDKPKAIWWTTFRIFRAHMRKLFHLLLFTANVHIYIWSGTSNRCRLFAVISSNEQNLSTNNHFQCLCLFQPPVSFSSFSSAPFRIARSVVTYEYYESMWFYFRVKIFLWKLIKYCSWNVENVYLVGKCFKRFGILFEHFKNITFALRDREIESEKASERAKFNKIKTYINHWDDWFESQSPFNCDEIFMSSIIVIGKQVVKHAVEIRSDKDMNKWLTNE